MSSIGRNRCRQPERVVDADQEGSIVAEMEDPGPAIAILRPEQRSIARRQGLALSTRTFGEVKVDYAARDSRNRSLGFKGEMLVAAHEKACLWRQVERTSRTGGQAS